MPKTIAAKTRKAVRFIGRFDSPSVEVHPPPGQGGHTARAPRGTDAGAVAPSPSPAFADVRSRAHEPLPPRAEFALTLDPLRVGARKKMDESYTNLEGLRFGRKRSGTPVAPQPGLVSPLPSGEATSVPLPAYR